MHGWSQPMGFTTLHDFLVALVVEFTCEYGKFFYRLPAHHKSF